MKIVIDIETKIETEPISGIKSRVNKKFEDRVFSAIKSRVEDIVEKSNLTSDHITGNCIITRVD